MKNLFTCLLFLSALAGLGHGTAKFTPPLKEAYKLITELRFEEARQIIREVEASHPENKVTDYLEGAMLCGEIFALEDRQRFDDAEGRFSEIIVELEKIEESEPFRDLFLGEIHLAQATLNGKFGNTFRAAWQFYKAYNLLTKNNKRFPEFYPNYLPLGVLYAGIGSLPEDYRSLASLLGFEGNVNKGMQMVKKAYWRLSSDEDLGFYRPYAGFIYAYLQYQLGTDEEPVSPVSLGLDVKNSSFLIFLQAQIDLSRGNAGQALQWLRNRPKGSGYLPFNYLNYLQGKIELGIEPEAAVNSFEKYLQQKHSQVYVKSTYRYLTWFYLLENNPEGADRMREEVFRQGNTETGADKQALLEAKQGFNVVLIRARLLFDVGRLEEARKCLEENPIEKCCGNPVEKAEYYYRYGRILDEMGDEERALEKYKKALGINLNEDSYSQGNSALMAALIYEDRDENYLAKTYFREALKYSGFPFYEGIHQKAKAGLSRL